MVKKNEEDGYKCKDIDITDAKNDKATRNVEKKAKTEMKCKEKKNSKRSDEKVERGGQNEK